MKTILPFILLAMLSLGACDRAKNPEKPRVDTLIVYKTDTVFIPVYEGYVHPSGKYKWTKKGWTRLIQIK